MSLVKTYRLHDQDHIQCWRPWWLACPRLPVLAAIKSLVWSHSLLPGLLHLPPASIFLSWYSSWYWYWYWTSTSSSFLPEGFPVHLVPVLESVLNVDFSSSSTHPPGCKLWPNFSKPDALSDIMCHRCPLFIFFKVQYNIKEARRGKLSLLFHM